MSDEALCLICLLACLLVLWLTTLGVPVVFASYCATRCSFKMLLSDHDITSTDNEAAAQYLQLLNVLLLMMAHFCILFIGTPLYPG